MTRKNTDPLIERARIFATAAHAAVGQKRKYTGEPYIHHVAEVARLVARYTDNDPVMVAAAWLHDVIEDTSVEASLIVALFGREVSDMVAGLTSIARAEDGSRAQRKMLDLHHLARQSPECKTVKLADIVSNTSSIATHDPRFARVYLAEKHDQIQVLREGNPQLLLLAVESVESGMKTLGMPT